MALPEVRQSVQDYGMASVPASTSSVFAKIGVCSAGAAKAVSAWAGPNLQAMLDALGHGPLVEACAYHRAVAGGEIITCPAATSVVGTAGAVTHTGTGTSVLTITTSSKHPLDGYNVIVTITRAGASLAAGTAAFTFSLDGGTTPSPEIALPTSGSYEILGTGIVLTFAEGTFVADDTYTFTCTAPAATLSDITDALTALMADPRTWGWVHVVGAPAPSSSAVTKSNPSAPAITLTGTPTAFVDAIVKMTLGGTLGTAKFEVSIDNGVTYGAEQTTSSGTPTYVITGTGLTLNFAAGTYVISDTYSFGTYGGIGALFAAVAAKLSAAEESFRYVGAVLELPDASDALLLKATAALASTRVMYAGGYCDLASSTSQAGRGIAKRPDAWPLAAWRGKLKIHEDLGKVKLGSLKGISALYRDEAATPGFGAGRIATLRTIVGFPGFYAASDTNGDMMAPAGSDYSLSQYRAIMDRACTVNRAAMIPYLNTDLRLKKTGEIAETEARTIETKVGSQLEAALLNGSDGRQVNALRMRIDRTEKISVTHDLTTDIALQPLGVAKTITTTLHYVPQL
jgi:hypothetical protein